MDIITVQAPQPPTPQPFFVPERQTAKDTVKEKKLQHSKVIFSLYSFDSPLFYVRVQNWRDLLTR